MLVQALIPSHASRLLGNRNAVLAGIACSCFALAVMAFAQSGWMIFAIMPIFALGSMGTPSLQALASQKVSADQQGQFQGVIASTVSILYDCPYVFLHSLFSVSGKMGAIWLSVILIYLLTLPIILYSTRPVVQQR